MNKELEEAIEGLDDKETLKYIDKIANNANPSEVLKIVNDFDNGLVNKEIGMIMFNQVWFKNQLNSIKQALIKAQEQEKVIIELCEYCGMDNLYPYDNLEEIEITFKDTFDNYQLQRIKSLGRLDKQNKVLEIIKKKNVDIYVLKTCINLEHYNSEIRLKNQNNTYSYEIWYELTQEEFDLLKEVK